MEATLPRVGAIVLLVFGLVLGGLFLVRGGITSDSAARNKIVGSWHTVKKPERTYVFAEDGVYRSERDRGSWTVEAGALVLVTNGHSVFLRLQFPPPEKREAPRAIDISGERYLETK